MIKKILVGILVLPVLVPFLVCFTIMLGVFAAIDCTVYVFTGTMGDVSKEFIHDIKAL